MSAYTASKAGAENLALAVRQEVAHLGIGVGSCHPGWVDTDIVRGAENDLPSFKAMRKKLPWPSNTTATVEEAVDLILRGFAKRAMRVYVPGKVMAANWTRALVSSSLLAPFVERLAGAMVPQMEREVTALGRQHHDYVIETPAVRNDKQVN
jgi:NAD(P)-dependent dehydrogenase (short-subunit alcohol dehydrogenase family)